MLAACAERQSPSRAVLVHRRVKRPAAVWVKTFQAGAAVIRGRGKGHKAPCGVHQGKGQHLTDSAQRASHGKVHLECDSGPLGLG